MRQRVVARVGEGLVDPEAPLLRADDLGVLRGDGAFETILVIDGRAVEFEAHLARLARSAAMLDLPLPDPASWRSCARAVIDAWGRAGEMALRLVLTRGPEAGTGSPDREFGTAYATGTPVPENLLTQRRTGVTAITLSRGIAPDVAAQAPWLLLGAKTLSYATNMAALRHAERVGAQDVVFTASDGTILEGPTSTVVVMRADTLRTPPAELGILPGTTQAALFRAAAVAGWTTLVEPLTVPDLLAADGVWLCSSVRLITRVHTLDGCVLPDTGRTETLRGLLPLPRDPSA